MIVLFTVCTANNTKSSHFDLSLFCQSNERQASKIVRNRISCNRRQSFHVMLIICDVQKEKKRKSTIFGIRRSIFINYSVIRVAGVTKCIRLIAHCVGTFKL